MDDELVRWGNRVEARVQAEHDPMSHGVIASLVAGLLLPAALLLFLITLVLLGLVTSTWCWLWLADHW